MHPVNFEDMNCIFKAQGCGDLPALKRTSILYHVGKWQKRKRRIYKTGKIYLSVMGNIQPPVSLYVDRPYIKQ